MNKCALLFAAWCLAAPVVWSGGRRQAAGGQVAAAQAAPPFDQTADGYSAQFNAVLKAFKSGDRVAGILQIEQYRVPNEEKWFADHLPADKSAALQARYDKLFLNFEISLQKTVEEVLNTPGSNLASTLATRKWTKPSAAANQTPSGITAVNENSFFVGNFAIKTFGKDAGSWAKTFAYEDGAFRFVGSDAGPFWTWQDDAGMTDPSGGHVMRQPVLIDQVQAAYPPMARVRHIQGNVVLNATIGKDGSVKDLKVAQGDPILAQSAMDAVRQYRYTPATMGGDTVETTIDVTVNFNPRNAPR